MEYEDRQKLTNRIIAGYTPVIFHSKIYRIYDPNPIVEHEANFRVENFCKEFLIYDVPTEENVAQIVMDRGIWNETLEKENKALEDDYEKLQTKLRSLEFKSREKRYVDANIKANVARRADLQKQKHALSNNSLEYLLKIERYKYIIFKNTTDDCGVRLWESWEDFDNNADNNLVVRLIQSCFFSSSLINEKTIRELSRSDPWRLYWRTAVKTGRLFEKPSAEMTDLQRNIVSWSMLYDNVYESSDCPDDEIIKDDDALDAWLEQQNEKRKKDKSTKKANNINVDSKYTDVGIMIDSPEDAARVYEMNSPEALLGIKRRQEEIQRKGSVEEQNLSDSQRKMRMQANQKAVDSRK